MSDFWTIIWLAAVATFGLMIILVIPFVAIFSVPVLLFAVWWHSDRSSEARATVRVYWLYRRALTKHQAKNIDVELARYWPEKLPREVRLKALEIGRALVGTDGIDPPPDILHSVEGARYEDKLQSIINSPNQTGERLEHASLTIGYVLRQSSDESQLTIPYRDFSPDLANDIKGAVGSLPAEVFPDIHDTLDHNFMMENHVDPSEYKGDDIVSAYFKGTPLADLFDLPVPIDVRRTPFEHTHMVAAIGHGKTQTIQYLINHHLPELMAGDCSIIVIDSQAEMIRNVLLAADVDPSKYVYINPRDVQHPPALNLFDTQLDRLDEYSEEQQEQLTNATIEIYEYLFGGVFGADLTSKQGVAFRFVIRLVMLIPDATIETLLGVMEDHTRYNEYILKMGGHGQRFFDKEFGSQQFKPTREQVIRRIYTILENPTLARMFSAKRSKLDLFKEMNAGKLILLDCAKDHLKEDGTMVMERFFVAKLIQAAQERANLKDKLPCYVFMDEAQDAFDDRMEVFLSQLRKQKVGGFFAHQFLDQMSNKLQSAFMANTLTKMVGGVSMKDARAFAAELRRPPDFITDQPQGTFTTFIKNHTPRAVAVSVPFFVMENGNRRSDDEYFAILDDQRQKYGHTVYSQPVELDEPDDDAPSYEL